MAYKNVWAPLGVAYIIAYLKKHRSDLAIKFYDGTFDSDETIITGAMFSDVVCFSCTSPTFQKSVEMAEKIKKGNPKVKIVFGGWHVTAMEDNFPTGMFDFNNMAISGEGESLMNCAITNAPWPILKGGDYIQFDNLPWPDREAIKHERYMDLCEQQTGLRIGSFQAHRGCPMNCTFCAESCMTGKFHRKNNPIRQRNINDLCHEIMDVEEKYNINYLKFVDATFDSDPNWVIEFCDLYRRFHDNPWEAMLHAQYVTKDMLYFMKIANCNQVNIGVESGSDRILKQMRKGVDTKQIKKVFGWAKEFGIKTRAFFLLGMPDESEADHDLTEKLIEEINPDVVGFTMLCPYPGTDYYDHKTMWNIDWSKTDEYINDFWRTKHFTNEQLKAKQQYFVDLYKGKLCERQA